MHWHVWELSRLGTIWCLLGQKKQTFSRYLAGKVLPCCHDNSSFIIIGSSEQLVDVGQVVHTRCVA